MVEARHFLPSLVQSHIMSPLTFMIKTWNRFFHGANTRRVNFRTLPCWSCWPTGFQFSLTPSPVMVRVQRRTSIYFHLSVNPVSRFCVDLCSGRDVPACLSPSVLLCWLCPASDLRSPPPTQRQVVFETIETVAPHLLINWEDKRKEDNVSIAMLTPKLQACTVSWFVNFTCVSPVPPSPPPVPPTLSKENSARLAAKTLSTPQ